MTKHKTTTLILVAIILASSVLAFAFPPAAAAAPAAAPLGVLTVTGCTHSETCDSNTGNYHQYDGAFSGIWTLNDVYAIDTVSFTQTDYDGDHLTSVAVGVSYDCVTYTGLGTFSVSLGTTSIDLPDWAFGKCVVLQRIGSTGGGWSRVNEVSFDGAAVSTVVPFEGSSITPSSMTGITLDSGENTYDADYYHAAYTSLSLYTAEFSSAVEVRNVGLYVYPWDGFYMTEVSILYEGTVIVDHYEVEIGWNVIPVGSVVSADTWKVRVDAFAGGDDFMVPVLRFFGEAYTPTPTPSLTPSVTLTPSATATPTITPTPGVGGGGAVWHIGNYIEDDSFEGIDWFQDAFFPRWQSLGNFGRGSTSGALCGNRYGEFLPGTTVAGVESYYIQPFGIWQEVLWWGGDMYVSFAYRTVGTGSVTAYLVDPFNKKVPIASGLTSTGGWTVYYGVLEDQLLGRYQLSIEGGAISLADRIHIDAISVSEKTYVHCTYLSTPTNPPPAAGAQTAIIPSADESTEPFVPEWEVSSSNATITGVGITGTLGLFSSSTAPLTGVDVPLDPIWEEAIDDAFAKSRNWIDVLEDELNAPKGLPASNGVYITSQHLMVVTYIASDLANDVVALENIETGTIIRWNATNIATTPAGWHQYYDTISLPAGRYRLITHLGAQANPVYIDHVCAGAKEFILTTNACEELDGWGLFNSDATVEAMAVQVTAVNASTGTAAAAIVQTQNAIFAATGTPRAAITQTALVAINNGTAIVRATQTQAYALTRTPQIAASRTAWVNQWRGTLTAAAGITSTWRAQVATANANGSIQATQQAAVRNTAYAQATNSAQLTAIVHHQATLSSAATQQVQNQPTVDVIIGNGAATLAAAQTELAAAPANATAQAHATAAAQQLAVLESQSTAYYNLQQTVIAQMTAQPNTNATLQAQATLIQQQQQTMIATLQYAGTQQVLQMPVDQPMPENEDEYLGCERPTNPLNVSAWIDYEVCRILWYVTWNPTNTTQVTSVATEIAVYEPYGTLFEVQGIFQDIESASNQYDWGQTGWAETLVLPQVMAAPNTQAQPGGVVFIGEAVNAPILMGQINLDPNEEQPMVFSHDCDFRLATNIGPYLTPPICFLIDVTTQTGYLPLVQFMFDLGAVFLLVRFYFGTFLDIIGERAKFYSHATQGPSNGLEGEWQSILTEVAKRKK